MSWLNSELPNDWPSKKDADQSGSDFEFSTTRSGGSSLNGEPTVAIQSHVVPGSEPWRHAIQAPQDSAQENSQRLTKLFVPPPDFAKDADEDHQPTSSPLRPDQILPSSFNSTSSSSHDSELEDTTSSPRSSRANAPDRRLKVFGRPDTYTSERLGNLLSSMGGINHASTSSPLNPHAQLIHNSQDRSAKAPITRNTLGITPGMGAGNTVGTSVGPTAGTLANTTAGSMAGSIAGNTTANESDADLADQLQNEGRKVLQGLAPFRSTLPPVQESSLDQLEQQLTSQGTSRNSHSHGQDPGNIAQQLQSMKFDTTSSTFTTDSGNTLESLPAGLSNWDTMGPIPHHQMPKPSYLHRSSSQTLIGSGGRHKINRQTELADLEAEISALGIHEAYGQSPRAAHSSDAQIDNRQLSAETFQQHQQNQQHQQQQYQHQNQHQHQQHRQHPQYHLYDNPRQQEVQTQQVHNLNGSAGRSASPISTSQRSSSIQSRLSNSEVRVPLSTSESEHAYARQYSNARPNMHAYDVTPETIIRRNLRFKRPLEQQQQRQYSGLSSSPQPHSSTTRTTSRSSYRGSSRVTSGASTRRTVRSSELSNDEDMDGGALPLAADHSIADKNMSFSAGYELLAELIRERATVPGINPQELDSLDLSKCGLESIVGLDQFTPHLTTLFLNDNEIRNLEGLPFDIVHLDLSSNRLSFMNLFPQSFVSTLILANNELHNLEPLANLRALSSLDVSNNRLTSLKGIENLTALRTLNVNNNQLTAVDINLGMLTELSASHNDIRAVRINAPNLETLDLEANRVIALTEPLSNVRELNIRFNDATVDFRGWESLETLLFDGNQSMVNIEEVAGNLVTFSWEQCKGYKGPKLQLPKALLTSARDLKLGGASSIGWPFGGDRNTAAYSTQHLDLCNSGLRELPSNFSKLFPFLKSANFAFNKLSDDCISLLAECPNLERLSVFGNRLETTGERLAQKLPKLRLLDSRSQNRARDLIQDGEYPSDVYTPFENLPNSTGGSSQTGTLVKTHSTELQWLDGKWTTNSGSPRPTTRPAFPSALYPLDWNPPAWESGHVFNETVEASMIGGLNAWDVVEAMYVHHFLQAA